ncbi:lymphocyte antigen 6D-like [Anomaloglossus baeobatrachus]|uniref:lymphocyte antigen 6D-like n=1 Tax=Anomaloglossus baeobatrachus TaxID=238106 RepID=UPI003F4FD401
MAVHTSLLLVIALCAATGLSLRCFSCESVSSQCRTVKICSSEQPYCETKVEAEKNAGVGVTYTTQCTDVCAPRRGDGFVVLCCTTDLCNTSAAVTSSSAAGTLALGLLLTILNSWIL